MNKAFYTGASGLRAHQNNINIVGHNITNSATTGYKTTVPEFRELIYTNMDANQNRENAEDDKIKEGHGVKLSNDDMIFTQGSFHNTGYLLDFAIAGDGLFAVQNYDGQIEYTRNGSFDISIEGEQSFLVNSDGEYVLDRNYQKIALPRDPGTNLINVDNVKNTLGIFSFDNPNGLTRIDGGSFLPSENSGAPQIAQAGTYDIHQNTLERSNVELSQEMANLIVSQRAYSFAARVVTTADEVEQLVNSLRG